MPRPSVRLRLTLLYAGVFLVAGALLLSVSYVLVRNNLTIDPARLESIGPEELELKRAIQRELAADALHELRVQYAIALGAMTALSMLGGWAVAGRVLRPLKRITATAKRVSQETLDQRIALTGPHDELKELADTFDGMLERLAEAFASQRRFVANASHELRTPLSVMRTELDVTLADPDATVADLRRMAVTVRDATAETERLIQALLLLARSQAGVSRRDDVDLAEAARAALAHAGREAAAADLRIATDLRPAPARGERRLLERLVANLVDNAVRHNRPGGAIDVRTGVRDRTTVVEVVNDGPPIPAGVVDSLLAPFERLDRGARGDGAGLGLSIVRSVAEAHGGTVTLGARPEGGLRVRVELPATPSGRGRADSYEVPTNPDYAEERASIHA